MPSPVILILGAGPNIGANVAKTFAASGYKVAVAARSLKETESTDTQLNIPSDFSKPADVASVFSKVKKAFGIPSVVVYNGA
jgi:NAD(P)-dependent dehydrogenase (short-subunit alcohol dehydrogenase family)